MEYIILFSLLALFLYVISQYMSGQEEEVDLPCMQKEVHRGEKLLLWKRYGWEIYYYKESQTFAINTDSWHKGYYIATVLPTYYGFKHVWENQGHLDLIRWYNTGLTNTYKMNSFLYINIEQELDIARLSGDCDEYNRLLKLKEYGLV